jgi:FixJ family two-component response regulator
MTERPKSPREIASAEAPIVFVIDDDESMRRGLTNLFESVGLRVATFGSASEFLQRRLPDVPSCLVLDVRLPRISGLDFQVLLEKAEIHIPIVLMTGHGDIPMTVRAMKAGAADFLVKPFRQQEMLDAVMAAIERDRKRRKDARIVSNLQGSFRDPHRQGAGNSRFGFGRIIKQTDSSGVWDCRDYREATPRACYEKNGCEVIG